VDAAEPVVAVVFSVADGVEASRDWMNAQLRASEEMYAPLGVHFRLTEWRTLPASAANIQNRSERDALAPQCVPQVINVLVTSQLRDVDTSEEVYRMGVTWIGGGKKYIILSTAARATTLAHEIGHFFGLHHTKVKNNLMSYDRDGAPVFLDAEQSKTVTANARAMATTRQLVVWSWALPSAGPLSP
jgi:hypothetical protein